MSEGHVYNCTRRVVEALYAVEAEYIHWPSAAERRQESAANEEKARFIGAVGKLDGTDIILAEKPGGIFHPNDF